MILQNKTAIITGSTGGIGKEIAFTFAKQGAKVLLSGTSEAKLLALKQEIEAEIAGVQIYTKSCNLLNSEDISNLIKEGTQLLGSRLDILVANAGVTKDGLIIRMNEEDWDTVIDTNLKSTFLLCRDATKIMMKQKYGKIVLISSVVGVSGNAGQVNYCASKAGMIGFAKSLATEIASRNITVNCVAPGFIESPMTQILTEEQTKSIFQKIPMGRLGSGKEVADSVLFLSSDLSSYITGETINVNGGMYMQ